MDLEPLRACLLVHVSVSVLAHLSLRLSRSRGGASLGLGVRGWVGPPIAVYPKASDQSTAGMGSTWGNSLSSWGTSSKALTFSADSKRQHHDKKALEEVAWKPGLEPPGADNQGPSFFLTCFPTPLAMTWALDFVSAF